MKAAKTWCLASLVLVAGLSSASCGKDEGTAGGGGRGTIVGGSGGTAGSGVVGRSGSGGSGTQGGAGAVFGTKLGMGCVNDQACADPAAPGLTCVTGKDTVFGDGAPPKGLCTMPCTMPQQEGDEDTCGELGALCFPFTENSLEGYCMEGCDFGPPEIGETKCHNRAEFACDPALYTSTGTPCTTTDDCPSGDLCFVDEGECFVAHAACLPSCRGDLDCDAGMFCDIGFLNGTCVAEKPVGKQLGERCTVPAGNVADDECLGFCQADAATGNAGHCAATCGLGRQCSWNSDTEKYDGVCYYPTILTNTLDTAALGDFGFCTPTCNCSADCDDPTLGCELLDEGKLTPDFRGAGLCFGPGEMTVEYDQCTGEGGAGAGGESGIGGAGTAGDSGGAGGAN